MASSKFLKRVWDCESFFLNTKGPELHIRGSETPGTICKYLGVLLSYTHFACIVNMEAWHQSFLCDWWQLLFFFIVILDSFLHRMPFPDLHVS